jgi:hypothetical protein
MGIAAEDGKVSGPFLQARIAVDMNKPLSRETMLNKDKTSSP